MNDLFEPPAKRSIEKTFIGTRVKVDEIIDKQFKRWIYASGKPLQGLIKRRSDESKLCFS